MESNLAAPAGFRHIGSVACMRPVLFPAFANDTWRATRPSIAYRLTPATAVLRALARERRSHERWGVAIPDYEAVMLPLPRLCADGSVSVEEANYEAD